ncbi:hydroxyisourate hydrolase [Palleronia sp. LCG004]|uniref:hydroxyisourate hydrolase n=1 Tax=Palleronia sp. LCG004 TaxID=3079304 RepID=UPI002943E75C|nr:hydroxyisourate hydrolase [Palleronia sp. LCG004]WOI56555.1 hydroxyisourate hydrolase [Palleronia sp. LCG004]
MAGYLTTHVLDTARGCPAAGLTITLFRLEGETRTELARMVTNADGRTDAPILPESEFATGSYELLFHAGPYLGEARFLEDIPIRFRMDEAAHYHVPLLLSPYGYSTYRGS